MYKQVAIATGKETNMLRRYRVYDYDNVVMLCSCSVSVYMYSCTIHSSSILHALLLLLLQLEVEVVQWLHQFLFPHLPSKAKEIRLSLSVPSPLILNSKQSHHKDTLLTNREKMSKRPGESLPPQETPSLSRVVLVQTNMMMIIDGKDQDSSAGLLFAFLLGAFTRLPFIYFVIHMRFHLVGRNRSFCWILPSCPRMVICFTTIFVSRNYLIL